MNFRPPDEDVDLELDVDGDDSAKFGSEQYPSYVEHLLLACNQIGSRTKKKYRKKGPSLPAPCRCIILYCEVEKGVGTDATFWAAVRGYCVVCTLVE